MPRRLEADLYLEEPEGLSLTAGPFPILLETPGHSRPVISGDAKLEDFHGISRTYGDQLHAPWPEGERRVGVAAEREGSGLLRPVGKSAVDPRVVVPSADEVRRTLVPGYSDQEVDQMLRSHDFRSCCLTMTVEMKDPRSWTLDWARFKFTFRNPPASVLEYSPETLASPTKLQKKGASGFTISAMLTGKVDGALGTNAGPSYSASNGWTASFSAMVEFLRGSLASFEPGKQDLTWDLYSEKVLATPGGLGHTVVASGAALFGFPKEVVVPDVAVSFSGRARRPNRRTLLGRSIGPPLLGTFSLEPDQTPPVEPVKRE